MNKLENEIKKEVQIVEQRFQSDLRLFVLKVHFAWMYMVNVVVQPLRWLSGKYEPFFYSQVLKAKEELQKLEKEVKKL